MRKHTKTALAAAVVMVCASVAGIVSADDASDRERLIREIDYYDRCTFRYECTE